jgi:DNA-directed RNA polymerase alpha subunit
MKNQKKKNEIMTINTMSNKGTHQKRSEGSADEAREGQMQLPVDVLGLPPRLVSALHERGIKRLGQLCELTTSDLMCMRNIGFKSIFTIISALAPFGLALES